LQWSTFAIAGMAIMTFSSQELWAGNAQGLGDTIIFPIFYSYAILFVSIILGINIRDYQRICENRIIVVSCAFVSLVIDLGILSLSEFFILLTINQLGTDLLKSLILIFLIVLPWSLGEITLSSLTVEYMKKRVEKLQREIRKMRKESMDLEKGRKEGEKRLRELEKKTAEFEKSFEREKSSGGKK